MSAVATNPEIKNLTAPPACVKTTTHLCCTKKILARLQTRLVQRKKVCLKIIFFRMIKKCDTSGHTFASPRPPAQCWKVAFGPVGSLPGVAFQHCAGGRGDRQKVHPLRRVETPLLERSRYTLVRP